MVDEMKILAGDSINVADGVTLHQPTIREIKDFGEKEYLSTVQLLTAEPFDMPYYLSLIGIDFEKISPFELFCNLAKGMNKENTRLLFGDLDLSKFRVVKVGQGIELMNADGIRINSTIRETIADTIRRFHCLPKNIVTSCENEFTHDLLIQQQKKEIDRAERRKKLFGETSNYSALISSLACEWKSYNAVYDLTVGQFFDALIRLGYKINSQNLYRGIYSGCVSIKNISKKELDWMRPIKTRTL